MGFVRDEMAKSVATLILEFGQSMTLRRLSASAYNAATGVATNTAVDVAVTGVVVGFNKEDIDGDTILAGDRKAYIQLGGVNTPKAGDKLVGVDTDVLIVAVHKILRTNTDSIVCICQARS
jgi:hypothetical protein